MLQRIFKVTEIRPQRLNNRRLGKPDNINKS